MKKYLCIILCVCLLPLYGCREGRLKRFQATDLTLFDTVSVITGYARSKEEFDNMSDDLFSLLEKYSRLYDIYCAYDGVTNLRDINASAAKGAVEADGEIIDLLSFAKEAAELTKGKCNIAMGSVLSLWHESRQKASESPDSAALPDADALRAAAEHTDIENLIIDDEADTVRFADSELLLDVGAVAKGYAAEKAARYAKQKGYDNLLINLGGTVRSVGTKPDKTGWISGIENPSDTQKLICEVSFSDMSLVTSGNYQRFFTVDGKDYHHIIDPDTLFPAEFFSSVSVICEDAGLGDVLSTALFNMTEDEGRSLISSLDRQEYGSIGVMWVYPDGRISKGGDFSSYETVK